MQLRVPLVQMKYYYFIIINIIIIAEIIIILLLFKMVKLIMKIPYIVFLR